MTQASKNVNGKISTGKFILVGFSVMAITGLAVYLLTKDKNISEEGIFPNETTDSDTTAIIPKPQTPRPSLPRANVGFPLRKGSKGTLVKTLQKALMNKYGNHIFKHYKDDGDFGRLTEEALVNNGHPAVLTQVMYEELLDKLKGKKSDESPKPKKAEPIGVERGKRIAGIFHYAIKKKDFANVKHLLTLLKTTTDYSTVNAFFKTRDMFDGTRRTLVTGLLRFFTDSFFQRHMKNEFKRFGLKWRNNKWNLRGFGNVLNNQIKVVVTSTIWNSNKQTLIVQKDTILGEFLGASDGVTKFKTLDGKLLYAETRNVQYV